LWVDVRKSAEAALGKISGSPLVAAVKRLAYGSLGMARERTNSGSTSPELSTHFCARLFRPEQSSVAKKYARNLLKKVLTPGQNWGI
jgi:hypothetical protein